MARRKSALEPIVQDFLRNHPLALAWPKHEREAFIRALAAFVEERIAAVNHEPERFNPKEIYK